MSFNLSVMHPTTFHSATHCIVCGATYETCVCSQAGSILDPNGYDSLDAWSEDEYDTWDGQEYDGDEEDTWNSVYEAVKD